MSSLSELLRLETDLSEPQVLWLHHLIGDWQPLADMSFADLVLYVRTRTGGYVIGALCRPATATTAYPADPVGSRFTAAEVPHVDVAWCTRQICLEDQPEDDLPGFLEAVPVGCRGDTIAVLVRRMHHSVTTRLSPMESAYLEGARDLAVMVQDGQFPNEETPTGGRRGAPRVGDGMILLDPAGQVRYASPNALSCYHRLGHVGGLEEQLLARITTDLVGGPEPVDEALPLVVTGRAPMRVIVTSRNRTALSLRSIPLRREGHRIGALVLCRDITELHQGEQDLMSKDATIREIHHRVKNNLQTVSALLRMQARRMPSPEAKAALGEAMRRVATIALVHEVLSTGVGEEVVDLDELLGRAVALTAGLANSREHAVEVARVGRAGVVGARNAHTLALVVVELVANAMEHAGVPGREAVVRVETSRAGRDLEVAVADNGPGLPAGWRPGEAGLGTQIVEQLVRTELDGSISWESEPGVGTRVVIRATLS